MSTRLPYECPRTCPADLYLPITEGSTLSNDFFLPSSVDSTMRFELTLAIKDALDQKPRLQTLISFVTMAYVGFPFRCCSLTNLRHDHDWTDQIILLAGWGPC